MKTAIIQGISLGVLMTIAFYIFSYYKWDISLPSFMLGAIGMGIMKGIDELMEKK